jgi:hypothetical protein
MKGLAGCYGEVTAGRLCGYSGTSGMVYPMSEGSGTLYNHSIKPLIGTSTTPAKI